jgi:hypothetical protein
MINNSIADDHTYKWTTKPEVEVCTNMITDNQLNKSLSFWKNEINAEYSKITFFNEYSCPPIKKGVIQIIRNKNIVREYGKTDINYFYYDDPNDRTIESVVIKLSDHMIYEQNITLRHELGHAFGLLHENEGIMNPYY